MHKRIVLLLLIALMLAGCAERVRTPRVLPEWGRANLIGAASHSTPVGLVVSLDGSRVIMAWPTRAENATQDTLHLYVLDANGTVLLDHDMEPSIPDLYDVQVLLGPDNRAHLLWSAGEPNVRTLWYADLGQIDPANIAPLAAAQVSPPDQAVNWYKAARLPNGNILILWLEAHGELNGQLIGRGQPQRLLSDVTGADFQVDAAGNVHLVWSQQEATTRLALYRAQLAADTLTLTAPALMTTVFLPARAPVSSVEDPVLALDDQYAYINWVQREDQPTQVVKRLHTLTWALDGTTESYEMEPITHDPDFPPPSASATGIFAYRHLATSSGSRGTATNVYQRPATLVTQEAEAVLALPVQYTTRTRVEYQPTLIYMQNGTHRGFQALTWTDHTSVDPVVAADANHHLYVAWIETTGAAFHYPIYLASTAPTLRAHWQRMTVSDYATVAWDCINRIVSGVVLFPFVVVWFFLPMIWLFFKLARGGDAYGRAGQRLLLSALWLYWGGKYLLTFQILTYVPSLRYLPASTGEILIYLVPLLTLVLSVLVGGLTTIRWTGKAFSVMRTFLVTTATDAILSLCVYAIGYYE